MAHFTVLVQVKEVDRVTSRTSNVVSTTSKEERTVEEVYSAIIRKPSLAEALAAAHRMIDVIGEEQ